MAVNPATFSGPSRTDSSLNSRLYELTSTRPLPRLDIPVTVTLLAFGPAVNEALITAYSTRRDFLTRLSNTARLVAVTSWFLPTTISRALVFPLLLCGLPKLFATMFMLSAPILRMLMSQYEFWFTTVLNLMGMVLFAIQIGPDIRLGYPFLTFMSIQVTICSDADVYSLSETARAGVLSSVCAIALGLFASHKSVYYKSQPPSTSRDWHLAQVNFMTNVSLTLAIFIINKSYKRRHVFWQHLRPFVPLAVCRAKMSVRSKRIAKGSGAASARSVGRLNPNMYASVRFTEQDAPKGSSEVSASRRRSSLVLTPGKILHFRVVRLGRDIVDANRSLAPSICVQRRIASLPFCLLTLCGVVGLTFAIAGMLLIILFDNHSVGLLVPCALVSFLCTFVYCLFFAAHYQRDLLFLLLHNFDFWFTTFQFIAATACLADLLDWDFRCLNIISWSFWFLWSILTDALLPTYKRKLRFKKWHASIASLAIILAVAVIAFRLVFDSDQILHGRVIDVGSLRGFFTIVVSTGTFMGYRLATIMLWTCRIAWRLAFRPEEELVLLRGAIEYKNPFFQQTYVPAPQSPNLPDVGTQTQPQPAGPPNEGLPASAVND